ncbi:MAG TPA: AEC family transporter [Nostocaceae cyanobacterium]|nr:AEC family transporter [Nostocaceae cyanobacterium]
MSNLLELYAKLGGLILVGIILGWKLPATAPTLVGQFLFWVGVPITIVSFLRQTDLSGQIWIAPAIAHLAIFLGVVLAWLAIQSQAYLTKSTLPPATKGSFILASMVGNTGYLGFPVTLAMVGQEYFAWALFYDLLGSLFGAYGFGVILAARFGNTGANYQDLAKAIMINPALWSFGFGLLFRQVSIAPIWEFTLEILAWIALSLSLILIGMRLSRLNSWQRIPQVGSSLLIKMLIVPLIVIPILPLLGVTGEAAKVVVLQMAMPPAFGTLVLAETFNLDRDLAVTSLALGVVIFLFTLPLWLWLF